MPAAIIPIGRITGPFNAGGNAAPSSAPASTPSRAAHHERPWGGYRPGSQWANPNQAPPPPSTTTSGASSATSSSTLPPYELGTSPLETPASGNVAPSTDPGAYIDPTTGQVVGPTAAMSITNSIASWVAANPLLALFLAGVVVYFGMEMFGGGGHSHRRRY